MLLRRYHDKPHNESQKQAEIEVKPVLIKDTEKLNKKANRINNKEEGL